MSLHTGGCLCGAVRYEVAGPLAPVQFCHCADCRKAQGTAFAANIPVMAADFRLLQGEAALSAFESSPGKERVFCGRCGSPVMSRLTARPDRLRLRAGSLDDPAAATAGFHFWMDDDAGWLPVAEDLPRHPRERPE